MARTPGGKPFELVRGAGDFPGWRGVNTERGRTAPPSNQPQLAINLIAKDGRLRVRPHEQVSLTGLPWDYEHGMFDLECPPVRLWCAIEDCPGATGGTVMTYSFDDDPEFQAVAKFWGLPTGSLSIASYGIDVYIGELANLRLMHGRNQTYGAAAANTGEFGSRVVHRFTGTGAVIAAIREFDGDLWVGVNTTGPNYTVYQWNGVSMVQSITAAGTIASMSEWADNLVVTFNNAASNYIKLRSGGAGGAWTTVVPAAGSLLARSKPRTAVSHRGTLYIVDSTTGIWTYDGTTLQSAHTVAGATMQAIEQFNDKVFYAYDLASTCCIGEYEWATTTWTDVRKGLTAQYTYNRKVHGMAAHRGALWVGLGSKSFYVDDPLGSDRNYFTARLAVSPGKNVGGTWIGTGSASYSAGEDAVGPVLCTVV